MRKPPGYWKDISNIKREIEPLLKKYGRFPSTKEMTRDIGSSLPKYIMLYHGGIIELSKKLGIPTYDESIGRRHQGTWNKELVVEKFKKLLEEKSIDYYPSRNDLKSWGSDLSHGITQVFNTYQEFKEHLSSIGVVLSKKKKEIYWTDDKIIEVTEGIINDLGHIPSEKEFKILGKSTLRRLLSEKKSLRNQIYSKYQHLNVQPVKDDKPVSKKRKIKPKGYWDNPENIIEEINQMLSTHGKFLTQKESKEHGLSSLYNNIKRLDDQTLLELGYFKKKTIKPSGYWNDRDNIIKEIQVMLETYGRFLTDKELIEVGLGSLTSNIRHLDNETLNDLGYFERSSSLLCSDGHKVRSTYELLFDNFLFYNNLNHETEGVIDETNDRRFMYDFKVSHEDETIYVEIWGFTRGRTEMEKRYLKKKSEKEKIYKRLNLKLVGFDDRLFDQPFEKIYNEFSKKLSKHFPNKEFKQFDLITLIKGSHYSFDHLVEELRVLINENDGYFPSTTQMKKLEGGEGLVSRILKYGGVDRFKDHFNIDIKPKEVFWDLNKIKSELHEINQLKYIPSHNDLIELNKVDLLGGIKRYGGVIKVSEDLKIPTKSDYQKTIPKEFKGKWTDEKIYNKLNSVIVKLGRFPSEKDLNNEGLRDLYVGIKKRIPGGLRGLKYELGYNTKEKVQIKEGQKYGKLLVQERVTENRKKIIISVCDCGKTYKTRQDNFKDRYRTHKDSLSCGKCN